MFSFCRKILSLQIIIKHRKVISKMIYKMISKENSMIINNYVEKYNTIKRINN